MRLQATGLLGYDEQFSGMLAAGAFDAVGAVSQSGPAIAQIEDQRRGFQSRADAGIERNLGRLDGSAQFFPGDRSQKRLAGRGDDDERILAGPEPPGDQSGDE